MQAKTTKRGFRTTSGSLESAFETDKDRISFLVRLSALTGFSEAVALCLPVVSCKGRWFGVVPPELTKYSVSAT